MAHMDEKVMAAVAAALGKNPSASVDELFEMARGVNPTIGELSKRQFHARYPLQIKRKLNPRKRRKRRSPKAASGTGRRSGGSIARRDAVRSALLRFASDVAGAEERKDLVRVVANVDRYVDQVLEATGRK